MTNRNKNIEDANNKSLNKIVENVGKQEQGKSMSKLILVLGLCDQSKQFRLTISYHRVIHTQV